MRVTGFAAMALVGACAVAAAPGARGAVVVFQAAKDNTLYEATDGLPWSNGAGPFFYAGKTGTNAGTPVLRRAVIGFDVSSLPANAVIQSAVLTLHLSRAGAAGPGNIFVHRLTKDWGEGTADAGDPGGLGVAAGVGDATWTHNFHATSTWSEPGAGGDFAAGASSVRFVDLVGHHNFGDTPMASDVAGWLADPASNYGWIIRADEEALNSAKRFDSRESTTEGNRPFLTVTYEVPEPGSVALLAVGALGVLRRRTRR